jgi:aryl carrier-like protein
LINGYGPTENTTFTCCFPMDAPDDVGPSVSIGRPIANTQVYVLDSYREPVPVGAVGELYIGGDGLARDYLHDADSTAAKFVDHPFSEDPGARLYRTGDKARWRGNGTLEFLGRLDRQAKIRGFRVEPGEIEAVLKQHPEVHEAVVEVSADSREKRLLAYFTSDPQNPLRISVLRKYLSERLPRFMIPAEFVALDRLPLTVNGKVDRRALPAAERAGGTRHEHAFVAPRTELETALAEIWQDVLVLDRIGIHDNFIALGGDSLRAMEIMVRAQRKLHLPLASVSLFEHPTIAELVESLEASSPGRTAHDIPVVPRSGRLALSSVQQGLWFLDRYEPDSRAYAIILGYRIKGPLDASIIERCFQQVVDRHEILRTTFSEDRRPI